MREFDLGDVRTLVEPSDGRVSTPSNWWPLDESWMVYTDWDLWATKVSGPSELITSIESDQDLECTRWDRRYVQLVSVLFGRTTQNSLPSGSASTVHDSSPR